MNQLDLGMGGERQGIIMGWGQDIGVAVKSDSKPSDCQAVSPQTQEGRLVHS